MTRTLVLAVLLAVPAAAAPLPDHERDRLAVAYTFGAWTDPEGGSSYRADGLRLRVQLAGAPHRAGLPAPMVPVVPRFVRRVDGDFTAVVRVGCPTPPASAVVNFRRLAGGLLAVDAAGAHAALWRQEADDDGNRYHFGTYRTGPQGGGVRWSSREPVERVWLRLTRIGASVVFGCGPDEKGLRDAAPQPVDWAGPVQVGVYGENTTGIPAEVTFDRFTLTQPKKPAETAP